MEASKGHLTVQEVQERLREAGYPDSVDTIRRAIDRGTYGDEGRDWYRTETGYRMVRPAAVDAVIARRQRGPGGPNL